MNFSVFKTIISYFFWSIVSLFFITLCIPLSLLPEKIRYDNRLYFFLTTVWCKLLLFFSFIPLKIKGKKNLPKYPKDPSIFVMNHSSALDIIFTEIVIGDYPHIWLSKRAYAKVPLLNILLKRMHVLVNRNNPRAAVRALNKAYNLAKGGSRHLLLFPEGTRHSDGKIHEFLSGFAVLAKKLNRPIIPVAIVGAHKILPKKSFFIESCSSEVKIIIGKKFFYNKDECERHFSKRVHNWFKSVLEKESG